MLYLQSNSSLSDENIVKLLMFDALHPSLVSRQKSLWLLMNNHFE